MAVHHHGQRPGAVRGNRFDAAVHEGRWQTGRQQVHAGSRLKPLTFGKAPPDRPVFQPYWGKPAVRNERGDRGNVGIIRSPVRASILPDPWMPDAELVLPAVLAGAWDAGNDMDKQIIKSLSSADDYNTYEKQLRKFANGAESPLFPPLDREGTAWKVRAPMDA